MGGLLSAAISVGIWCIFFFEDLDVILSVNCFEVATEANSGARQPSTAWEGAPTLTDATGRANFIFLGETLMLSDCLLIIPHYQSRKRAHH